MNHGTLDEQTAKGLKVLRERIAAAKIPPSKIDETLNIATWNIREFGRKPRKPSSIHYIAEIIGQFDVVAVVELRDDLTDLERTLEILGPTWRVVFSDANSDSAGNRERIAFVYDKRAVAFTGLAAEADPPRKKDKITGEYVPAITWWRSPFLVSFRSGSFDFVMLAVHVRWAGDDAAVRIPELQLLADWIAKRQSSEFVEDKDLLVMGDFNIPSRKDATYAALTSGGLQLPKGLVGVDIGSNLEKDKRYDQILHSPVHEQLFTDKGGVLDFYAGDHAPLFSKTTMSKRDFTYQLSDHLPLWIQVNTDADGIELEQLLAKWS